MQKKETINKLNLNFKNVNMNNNDNSTQLSYVHQIILKAIFATSYVDDDVIEQHKNARKQTERLQDHSAKNTGILCHR